MGKKVLFLDFDGVLFDTLKEVYLISRYIHSAVPFLDEIDEKNYKRYSKYKYLVYNIWMFYYYNPIAFSGCDENEIVSKYQNVLLSRDKNEEEKFCRSFLSARRDLVNNHFDFWKNLEVPYEFFYGIKKLYDNKNVDIVIISKKNKNSILERFKTYNFDLAPDFVFAREILDNYLSKGEFINEYMEQKGYNSAIFVDDNINNLKTVQNNSVKTILALWGNTAPNDKGLNQELALDLIENYFISK
ncbi:MAG: hypothetical protein IJ877_08495 [Candidatus Gastranaerophilales bacterium]|nr:hypothetical protein [Candidatus Gastranaerophilales bacterium]